jgi:DNA processing protein
MFPPLPCFSTGHGKKRAENNPSMRNRDLKYWVALKQVDGIGNVGFQVLLDAFGSPGEVFAAPLSMLKAVPGIGEKSASRIKAFKDWKKVDQELDRAGRAGVSIITSKDPLYPPRLLATEDHPAYLYARGSLEGDDICVAVVGSRAAGTYGKYTTERLCRELALRGITVVSGLARGIDSAAHRGALAGRGRTIAVLGCGLDVVYPPENESLYGEIERQGALLSEFSLGTPPNAPNFPARNRIISGLSLGVVVVEASQKSGSLITARIALEQGREVFAVPGSIDSAGSRGTNQLIKQGAKLIENVDDILEEILPQVDRERKPARPEPRQQQPDERDPGKGQPPGPALGKTEKAIWQVLSQKPVPIDHIIAATGLPAREVLGILLNLELRELVEQKPGKTYIRKEP